MANLNLSEFTEKLFVADADHTFIWDTANAISKRVSRNSWLNSGTLTSDAPVTISQTWNAVGQTFKALVVNAAGTSDANSASGSLLADFQTGGVSKAWVTKQGGYRASIGQFVSGNGIGFAGGLNTGFYSVAGEQIFLAANNSVPIEFKSTSIVVNLTTTFGFGQVGVGADTILLRDGAANTLALRNGAAAQTFNVYGTSSASNANYARLALTCGLDGNATISTQALGTGTAGTVSINGVPVGRGKGSNTARNISIGDNSLGLNSTGADNTAVGFYALGGNGAGNYNTSFGSQSLFSSNSNHNVALGYLAGTFKAGGATNNPGNENIYIGSQTKALDTAQTNQIVIGYDATGIGSNSVVLGNDSITKTALKGNVGIGTTAPGAKLDVVGNIAVRNTATGLGTGYGIEFDTNSNIPRFSFVFNSAYFSTISQTIDTLQLKTSGSATAISLGSNTVSHVTLKTANGNLGIGTTSPTSNLTVAQSTAGVGTISVGAAGTTVTGVGTQFLNTFAVGQTITSAGQTLTISAIASDTSMTISPAAGAAISGQAYTLVGGTRFTVAGNGKVGIGANVFLERDGDNVLALRNGSAAQAFRVYNTYTAADNYERAVFEYGSNQINLGSDVAGSGVHRKLNILGAGIDFYHAGIGIRWSINTSGHFIAAADNAYDIGASGAARPRNVYVGSRITCGDFLLGSSVYFTGTANGRLLLQNTGATDFERLQLGGTTNLFPAIKRSSTTLQARLADDSAFAPIQGKLTTDTAFTGTTVTPTGFITLYDSTGAAYKVPCVPA